MILSYRIIPELIVSLGLFFMVSCTDSSSNPGTPDQPPPVPSVQSMAIDLSLFDAEQSNSDAGENFQEAAASIKSMQAIMSRSINLSVDLLANADTSEAAELSEGKWEWTIENDQPQGSLKSSVRLVAEQQGEDKIKWNVFLSSPVMQSNDQLFISGTTNNEVTEGIWTYHSFGRAGQPGGQEIAELDWEIENNENKDVSMELSILAGSNFSGSGMDYHTNGPVRTIELDNEYDEGETTIEYDAETRAGFIISPDYNDGEKACWNSDLKNEACSE
jgi:hypothetical protein